MNPLRSYIIVTLSYWLFMLTDGALRMLVLLYFHQLGYEALTLAFLFLLYEFFGIVTNLFGGWLGSRCGLKITLVLGLVLQVFAMMMLSFMSESWAPVIAIPFVMAAQALSGIAKDLTKMSSKTAIKFLIPADQQQSLFKWVSLLTGSKNAIKGIGFFFGGFLLQLIGFQYALWSMSCLIGLAFICAALLLPTEIGQAKTKNKLASLFTQGRNINILSSARVFLFGARDIWFVVGLPIFLESVFAWSFTEIGVFMALWVIAYGVVQSLCPLLIRLRTRGVAPDGRIALELSVLLLLSMATMCALYLLGVNPEYAIVIGLYIFGAIFALNSSVHSFLILDYADGDKAAINVGYYYMANAAGRLIGTLLSGLLYQYGGLEACLIGSVSFLLVTMLISMGLPKRSSQQAEDPNTHP